MEYVFAVLSIWLLFLGCASTAQNTASLVFLKTPFFIFAILVGLYSLSMFGLLSFTI